MVTRQYIATKRFLWVIYRQVKVEALLDEYFFSGSLNQKTSDNSD